MNAFLSYLQSNWQRLNLAQYGDPERLAYIVVTPRFRASGHVVFLIFHQGQKQPVLVAKMARLKGHVEQIDREVLNLQMLRANHSKINGSIPRIVACDMYQGYRFLLETALVGELMSPAVIRRLPEHRCELVIEWLWDIQPKVRRFSDADWFETIVERPFRQFESLFPLTAEESTLLEQTKALVFPLKHTTFPLVFEHGDLSHPNLFLLRDSSLGVVDWEMARADGVPMHDLYFFLSYIARAISTMDDDTAVFRTAFFEPDAWTRPYIERYARQFRLAPSLLKPLFVLCWSRYVIHTLRRLSPLGCNEAYRPSAALVQWVRRSRQFVFWRYAVHNVDALILHG